MTAQDRFDRDLAAWLDAETVLSAPIGLHADAIDRARSARQRPAWLATLRGADLGRAVGTPSFGNRPLATALVVLALLIAALVVALAAGAFRSDLVRPLGRNGVLAYSAMTGPGSTTEDLRFVDPDGTGDRLIRGGACPVFSADGSTLAFTTHIHAAHTPPISLYVAEADGSGLRPIPEVTDLATGEIAISPDGSQVAWVRSIDRPEPELWVSPTDGSAGRAILAAAPGTDEGFLQPAFSPDGTRLAFAVTGLADEASLESRGIEVVNIDGSDRRRVATRRGPDSVSIAWSPDGRSIAYTGRPDGTPRMMNGTTATPWGLYVARADGSGEAEIPGATYPEHLRWSPDGNHLALLTLVEDRWHLATIPMSGDIAAGPLATGPEHGAPFAWSPDGRVLAYVATHVRSNHSNPGVTSIQTIDPSFAAPPTKVVGLDRTITCVNWQWLAP